jgi:hypothetical protein
MCFLVLCACDILSPLSPCSLRCCSVCAHHSAMSQARASWIPPPRQTWRVFFQASPPPCMLAKRTKWDPISPCSSATEMYRLLYRVIAQSQFLLLSSPSKRVVALPRTHTRQRKRAPPSHSHTGSARRRRAKTKKPDITSRSQSASMCQLLKPLPGMRTSIYAAARQTLAC